jgi:hypothetical protein
MRLVTIAVVAAAWVQAGSMTGSITDPGGGAVPKAEVQAMQLETGKVFSAAASANGSYTLSNLPAGTYDVMVPPVGFSYARLQKKGIALKASQNLRLDLRVDWGGNLGTPGDDPLISNRAKWAPRGRPAPRTPEGKPDLSGVYYANKDTPEKAKLLPWADTLTKQRQADGAIGQPSNFCLPGDPLLTLPLFYKIVQSPSAIVMLWEGQPPGVRQVFLDQKDHSKSWGLSWLGHSIGRWEGDTLVVDTAAFNDQSWLGIFPHTEQLHLTERYRRPELARLEREVTVEDPGTFTKPWTTRTVWELAQGEEIHEYICNENEVDVPHMKAK